MFTVFPPHPNIPIPTKYFAVRSGQEMDLARVIAMNFMCYKFFFYISPAVVGKLLDKRMKLLH